MNSARPISRRRVVTALAAAGTLAGTALSHRTAPQKLRRGFAVFVIAVAAFLARRIAFSRIAELIEGALDAMPATEPKTVDDCVAVDADTRRTVQAWVGGPAPVGP